jgi:2-C-methyl-D-erythritol 4-phosphate cytidylyltransferase/2-C-methyl-D-erythritol 2,4-cyclodiphosphate synthase
MHVTSIIAAGGSGTRLGGPRPKQLLVLEGRTLLDRVVATFLAHPAVDELVVALPADLVAAPPRCLVDAPKPVRVVAGGARRQDSVSNAFDAAASASDVILVHDAARPFVSAALIGRTIEAAAAHGAAIAAIRANDTVKQVGAERVIEATLDRDAIYLAQTPQGFQRAVLAAAVALGRTGIEATDEAALAERAGFPVRVVDGEAANVKITSQEDLDDARRRAGGPPRTGRAGSGYDLHRLVAGRPLVLGGVIIPSASGAIGHSDADVVCHAVTDAVLGAASLGDIGLHFPDTDPRWKDASSRDLLSRAVALVAERGFEVGNVDVTVVLEAPKLRPYVDEMRSSLAAALGLDADRVSIKAKTNEGMDAIGRGEAIAAYAVALVRSRSSRS